MIKFIALSIWSIFCLGVALLPEGAACLIWHLVQPTDQLAKVALVAVLLCCGTGISVISAMAAFALWAGGVSAINP